MPQLCVWAELFSRSRSWCKVAGFYISMQKHTVSTDICYSAADIFIVWQYFINSYTYSNKIWSCNIGVAIWLVACLICGKNYGEPNVNCSIHILQLSAVGHLVDFQGCLIIFSDGSFVIVIIIEYRFMRSKLIWNCSSLHFLPRVKQNSIVDFTDLQGICRTKQVFCQQMKWLIRTE